MNKVLLLNTMGADYGQYMLTHGFFSLLGPERVVCYPHKNTFHGGRDMYPERTVGNTHYLGPGGPGISWSELWIDSKWWRAWEPERWPNVPTAKDGSPGFYRPLPEPPEKATWESVTRDIKNGVFKFIVLNDARWHSSAALSELQNKGFGLPVIMCDHEDYYQIRWDFIRAFGPKIYFKRSWMEGWTDWLYTDKVQIQNPPSFHPLPFGSIWDNSFVPWSEREIDIFCVFGETQVLRRRVAQIVKDFAVAHPELKTIIEVGHPFGHAEYIDKIRHSKIVIDHQRLGIDTVRTWEVLSTGACMVGDLCMGMQNPLVDKKHYIRYENDMSPEGDKQKLETLKETLEWAYQRPMQVQSIAEEGYRHIRAHHTTKAHAYYVLNTARGSVIDIGDLLDDVEQPQMAAVS